MIENCWSVSILKCDPGKVKDVLINLYEYAKGIAEVKSLHFIIRDRIEDKIVISFRFMVEENKRKILAGKLSFKLKNMISEQDFVIDPTPDHQMYKYEAWPWKKTLEERGQNKFDDFSNFLSKLSEVVIDMAKQDYFSSSERVEIAHVSSWILGCTEETRIISRKNVNTILTGLSDRIANKFYPYVGKDFQKMDS